ncbi:MAG: BamA/TamA family outer membrane protein [Bacteroidetes bacterium]|nr:BamA/TamA family outer membrane protein [Bacteroidota bacterium]
MRQFRIYALLGFALFWSQLVSAQFQFGQNKVQYKDFKWNFIQSDHFDLYFADGFYPLAEYAINEAESAYVRIQKDFKYSLNSRVSFIIYGSHNEFQQTNAIQGFLDEGIGGVTELFKNRVVLPFQGDYHMFAHVIHHELVHAVINDMFYGGSIQNIISSNIQFTIPLWFNEGLAEFSALDWDSNTDQFMRDAVMNTYLAPIPQLSGYFAYRGGQSVWYYITQKYGREKISEILHKMKSTRDVEQAFQSSIGLNFEELSDRWEHDLKVRYWPEIASRTDLTTFSKRLINHQKDGSSYNTSPAISPRGDKIVYMTDKNRYIDLFVMNSLDGKSARKLVDGQKSRDYEELHLLTPGISWSPDSKKIAVATKAGGDDAIMIIDVETGDDEKIETGLTGIYSVDWSRDGKFLVFQGLTLGVSDLYLLDMETRAVTNLTQDAFSDMEPAFSPDSKKIVFVSDRMDYTQEQLSSGKLKMNQLNLRSRDLYELDLDTRQVRRLTNTPGVEKSNPVYARDAKNLLFISDENGAYNIWHLNPENLKTRPLTNLLQGIQQLSVTYDGNRMAVSALNNAGYDIYTINNPLDLNVEGDSLIPNQWAKFRDAQKFDFTASETEVTLPMQPDSLSGFVFAPADGTQPASADTINFRDYQFSVTPDAVPQTEETIAEANIQSGQTRTEDGGYVINNYKLNFSPDMIYGNAEVTSLYGVYSQTNMLFSDMLGNHQIFFATSLVLDLKNSDFYLAYYYLPKRVDTGIFGFHSSRYFNLYSTEDDEVYFYRYRFYGGGSTLSYPFDKYNRVSLDLGYSVLSRENMDLQNKPEESTWFINPKLQFVHDMVLWGPTAPNTGTRYGVAVQYVPRPFSDDISFLSFSGDYRTYFRITDYSSFALRAVGALSNGKTPQRYFIGGVENWINVNYGGRTNFPIRNLTDYVFAEAGLPLRGHFMNEQNGTRYFITNAELRFPMLFWILPEVGAGNFFMGNIFLDLGSAWDNSVKYQPFGKNKSGEWGFKDLLGGTGWGVRTYFAYFLIRFDMAWSFDFRQSSKPKYYISLGGDF